MTTIPGDATTTAVVTAGGTFQSDIDFNGDVDWIGVTLVNGFDYGISVDADLTMLDPLDDPRVSLYDINSVFLGVNNDGGDGLNALITVRASYDGVYYIGVNENGNNDIGSYIITVNADDQDSDLIADATNLSVGTSRNRVIDVEGDADMFEVTLVEGFDYRITMEARGSDPLGDSRIDLFNAGGAFLGGDNDGGVGQDAQLDFRADASADFYVLAYESGNNATGQYKILVDGSDNQSDLFTTTAVLASGAPVSDRVNSNGDYDMFQVDLVEGFDYGFELVGDTANGDPLLDERMDLFNPGEGFLAFSTSGEINRHADVSGTFYVGVYDDGNNGVGDYTLSLNDSDDVSDIFSTTAVLGSGSPVTKSVDVDGDYDLFQVELTEGIDYGFTLVGDATNGNALVTERMDLFDTGESFIKASTSGEMVHRAGVTGTFFIGAYEDGNNGVGDYILTLNDADTIVDTIATTAVAELDVVQASSIDVDGDADMYRVTMQAGEDYDITLTGDGTADALVETQIFFYNGSGTFLGGSTSGTFSHTAGVTGDFYVLVQENGNNDTGGYFLTVSGPEPGLTGSAADDVLVGTQIGETLTGLEGNDTLIGLAGDDVIVGNVGKDAILGGDGEDVIIAGSGKDFVNGGNGNDDIRGNGLQDVLIGGKGADSINGGSGEDRLDGEEGADKLTGGSESDTFVYWDDYANDKIVDFEDGLDRIDMIGNSSFTSFLDVQAVAVQNGSKVDIDDGAQRLRLIDFDLADLDASDFLF